MKHRVTWAAGLAVLLSGGSALAEVVDVSDVAGLMDAINTATAGDEIVLASGTYAMTGASCSALGTAQDPIIVRSAEPYGALIEFDGVEGFIVTGAHWHFEDLDVTGVCQNDSNCEHAFHVVGGADGFVLRNSRVRDFNAQLKVNAQNMVAPNDGLIEGCDIGDTRGRQTSNPVTKLNIDGGLRWIVRGNYLHDFHKDGGNTISYGAFMKSGGGDGIFEKNLVLCTSDDDPGGARIGLSFGGGGTAPQFCAPAYDAGTPCSIEHDGGTMRNNIIANCSDVGIYLNRSVNTTLSFNTLVGTTGIDFRFDTTSGLAHGNLVSGPIRNRDGASHTATANTVDVSQGEFDAWYTDPLHGDLSLAGDVGALTGQAAPHASVDDDYCHRSRPGADLTVGALEHSHGDCATFPVPAGGGVGGGSGGGGGSAAGAGGATSAGGASASSATGSGAGTGAGNPGTGDPTEDEGCSCRAAGAPTGNAAWLWLLCIPWLVRRRRA